jgi:hypothetical protein
MTRARSPTASPPRWTPPCGSPCWTLAAAAEITRELAPGSVELRLRGDGPEFVVTPPPAAAGPAEHEATEAPPADEALTAEANLARINLRLLVKGIRRWRAIGPLPGDGSVDVRMELPAGSRVTGQIGMGTFRCTGPLGDLKLRSGAGDIHVEEAAAVSLATGAGDIDLRHAAVDAQLTSGTGAVRAGRSDGAAAIRAPTTTSGSMRPPAS